MLDTHALIWFLIGSPKLSSPARQAIEDDANDIYISAATAMEAATKFRIGKLPDVSQLVSVFETTILQKGFLALPISVAQADAAGGLPIQYKDPFDRFLIAQALVEDLILVSNEVLFDGFGVQRLW